MSCVYHYTKYDVLKNIAKADCVDLIATYYKKYRDDDYEWLRNDASAVVSKICQDNGWDYDAEMLALKPFITCFCTNPNSRYMWEHYGDKDAGVKLILDKELMSRVAHCYGQDENGQKQNIGGLECMLPCTYIERASDAEATLIKCMQENHFDNGKWSCYEKLALLLASLKMANPYKNEEEYRYMCLYPVAFTMSYAEGDAPTLNDDVIPSSNYLHLFNPKELLLGVELGRNTTKEDLDKAVNHLVENGYLIESVIDKTILTSKSFSEK